MTGIILFDLDGTISNSGPGITHCVAYALDKFGIHVSELSQLNCFVGPPLRESFSVFYGFSREDSLRAIEYYRERYQAEGIHETAPYPGVCTMIHRLKTDGRRIALATSKPEVFARQIIDEYGLTDCFDAITGCELDGTRSKKTEVMAECIRRLGLTERDLARTAMVGDRNYDVLAARELGVHAVAVSYGYAPPGELEAAGAEYIASDTDELYSYLMSI